MQLKRLRCVQKCRIRLGACSLLSVHRQQSRLGGALFLHRHLPVQKRSLLTAQRLYTKRAQRQHHRAQCHRAQAPASSPRPHAVGNQRADLRSQLAGIFLL